MSRPARQLGRYAAITGYACLLASLLVLGPVVMWSIPREPLALSAYLAAWLVVILAALVAWMLWERRWQRHEELPDPRRHIGDDDV